MGNPLPGLIIGSVLIAVAILSFIHPTAVQTFFEVGSRRSFPKSAAYLWATIATVAGLTMVSIAIAGLVSGG